MPKFKTLDDLDVAGKTVLVRVDFNVPMADGKVSDATRIERAAPTIKDLTAKGAKVFVLSHFGRPKGKPNPEMSLKPLVPAVSRVLGQEVAFAEDCVGAPAEAVAANLAEGGVALLENLRFHAGEEANDPAFCEALAALGDIYVSDAFSAAHRAHASTEGVARLLPAAAGRLMQAELEHLAAALEKPKRPVAAIVGGAKISTKLDLLGNLVAKVDMLVIGGGMANTFLKAVGVKVGNSLCEHDMAGTAKEILEKAGAANETVSVKAVPSDKMILDCGPATAEHLAKRLTTCATLVWNGPLGAFEIAPFDAATVAAARYAAAETTAGRLVSVAGGGDTVAALNHAGVMGQFTYVSTAGGAFLEWMEGKDLPGVAALST